MTEQDNFVSDEEKMKDMGLDPTNAEDVNFFQSIRIAQTYSVVTIPVEELSEAAQEPTSESPVGNTIPSGDVKITETTQYAKRPKGLRPEVIEHLRDSLGD